MHLILAKSHCSSRVSRYCINACAASNQLTVLACCVGTSLSLDWIANIVRAALITLPLLIAKGKNQPLVASNFLQTSNKVPLGVSVRASETIRFACGIFKIPLSK